MWHVKLLDLDPAAASWKLWFVDKKNPHDTENSCHNRTRELQIALKEAYGRFPTTFCVTLTDDLRNLK